MGQAGSVPGQGVSSLAAAELCKKWMLRMRRSSRMAVTDSGYPGEAEKKKSNTTVGEEKGTGSLSKKSLAWTVACSVILMSVMAAWTVMPQQPRR